MALSAGYMDDGKPKAKQSKGWGIANVCVCMLYVEEDLLLAGAGCRVQRVLVKEGGKTGFFFFFFCQQTHNAKKVEGEKGEMGRLAWLFEHS